MDNIFGSFPVFVRASTDVTAQDQAEEKSEGGGVASCSSSSNNNANTSTRPPSLLEMVVAAGGKLELVSSKGPSASHTAFALERGGRGRKGDDHHHPHPFPHSEKYDSRFPCHDERSSNRSSDEEEEEDKGEKGEGCLITRTTWRPSWCSMTHFLSSSRVLYPWLALQGIHGAIGGTKLLWDTSLLKNSRRTLPSTSSHPPHEEEEEDEEEEREFLLDENERRGWRKGGSSSSSSSWLLPPPLFCLGDVRLPAVVEKCMARKLREGERGGGGGSGGGEAERGRRRGGGWRGGSGGRHWMGVRGDASSFPPYDGSSTFSSSLSFDEERWNQIRLEELEKLIHPAAVTSSSSPLLFPSSSCCVEEDHEQDENNNENEEIKDKEGGDHVRAKPPLEQPVEEMLSAPPSSSSAVPLRGLQHVAIPCILLGYHTLMEGPAHSGKRVAAYIGLTSRLLSIAADAAATSGTTMLSPKGESFSPLPPQGLFLFASFADILRYARWARDVCGRDAFEFLHYTPEKHHFHSHSSSSLSHHRQMTMEEDGRPQECPVLPSSLSKKTSPPPQDRRKRRDTYLDGQEEGKEEEDDDKNNTANHNPSSFVSSQYDRTSFCFSPLIFPKDKAQNQKENEYLPVLLSLQEQQLQHQKNSCYAANISLPSYQPPSVQELLHLLTSPALPTLENVERAADSTLNHANNTNTPMETIKEMNQIQGAGGEKEEGALSKDPEKVQELLSLVMGMKQENRQSEDAKNDRHRQHRQHYHEDAAGEEERHKNVFFSKKEKLGEEYSTRGENSRSRSRRRSEKRRRTARSHDEEEDEDGDQHHHHRRSSRHRSSHRSSHLRYDDEKDDYYCDKYVDGRRHRRHHSSSSSAPSERTRTTRRRKVEGRAHNMENPSLSAAAREKELRPQPEGRKSRRTDKRRRSRSTSGSSAYSNSSLYSSTSRSDRHRRPHHCRHRRRARRDEVKGDGEKRKKVDQNDHHRHSSSSRHHQCHRRHHRHSFSLSSSASSATPPMLAKRKKTAPESKETEKNVKNGDTNLLFSTPPAPPLVIQPQEVRKDDGKKTGIEKGAEKMEKETKKEAKEEQKEQTVAASASGVVGGVAVGGGSAVDVVVSCSSANFPPSPSSACTAMARATTTTTNTASSNPLSSIAFSPPVLQLPPFLRQRIPVLLLTYQQLTTLFCMEEEEEMEEKEGEEEEMGGREEKENVSFPLNQGGPGASSSSPMGTGTSTTSGNPSKDPNTRRKGRTNHKNFSTKFRTTNTSLFLPIEHVRICAFFDVDHVARPPSFSPHHATNHLPTGLPPACWTSLVNTLDIACQMVWTTRGGGGGGGGGGTALPVEEIYEWLTQTLLPNVGEGEVWGWRMEDQTIRSLLQLPMALEVVKIPPRSRPSSSLPNAGGGGRSRVGWLEGEEDNGGEHSPHTGGGEGGFSKGKQTANAVEVLKISHAAGLLLDHYHRVTSCSSETAATSSPAAWEGPHVVICCSSRREEESLARQLPRAVQERSASFARKEAEQMDEGACRLAHEKNNRSGDRVSSSCSPSFFPSLLRFTTSAVSFLRGEAEILIISDSQLSHLSAPTNSQFTSTTRSSSSSFVHSSRSFSLVASGISVRFIIHFSVPRGLLQREPAEVEIFLHGRARALLGGAKSIYHHQMSSWRRKLLEEREGGMRNETEDPGDNDHDDVQEGEGRKRMRGRGNVDGIHSRNVKLDTGKEEEALLHSTSLLPFSLPTLAFSKVRVCVLLADFQLRGPGADRLQEALF